MKNLNYSVVGNCRSAALISEKGSLDWLCLPKFDSPSVFAKILDEEKGGSLEIVVSPDYRITQEYIPHTNVVTTTFESAEGSFEVVDFMPRYKAGDKTEYYMPTELYRMINLVSGHPRLKILYNPRPNYADGDVYHVFEQNYIKTFLKSEREDTIYLYSSLDLDSISDFREIELTSNEFLLVSYNQKVISIDMERVYLEYSRTKLYWMNWSNRSKKYTLFNDYVERSMLVLKLMSYHPTGAVLAAITTSIPEIIGDVRNWDYRYCWLRDASMSIDTLIQIGHSGAARRFINFISNILHSKSDNFQIMYGIHYERTLEEKELTHLSGFEGSRPVRIGNAAYSQKQNDIYGYLMNVIYMCFIHFRGTLSETEDLFEVVKHVCRIVIKEWRNPDSGIWEIRNYKEQFVSSKVMCWVALDRAAKISRLFDNDRYATLYEEEAKLIKQDVFENGWKEEIKCFSQTYSSLDYDASLLLMEKYGFISADDPKYKMTVDAIYEHLSYNGLMFRYNHNDDFGKPKSAFTICNFWMVRGLYVTGRREEAIHLFERMLSYSNHVKLFSEDLDFETKQQLGNFPQAYSHLALIDTAMLFSDEVRLPKFIRP